MTSAPLDGIHSLLLGTHRAFLKQHPDSDIPLPEYNPQVRFEHTWIVGGTGHGKTQLLQHLIHHDLVKVRDNEASVIVIDSQGDLIRTVSNLRVFAPDHPLHEKLVLIDPHDIQYPVSLNLFDVVGDRTYSPLEREKLTSSVIELYDFVLGSLLQAEMTSKQSTVFRFITRLMLHIPDATIHTLRELLEPKGYEKYKHYIDKLDATPQAFFKNEFNESQFKDTRQQVLRRLYGVLENVTFERMFSHPRSKLDLFEEMNAGKVILINTAKDLLRAQGTQLFGRFFIALITQAAQERAAVKDRIPCYVYIDEFHEYADQNIATILEQARKYKVGLTVAHQYLGQIPDLLASMDANTSIKIAGGVSSKDAKALEGMIGRSPPPRPLAFLLHIKGSFPQEVKVPVGSLESRPKMTPDDRKVIRELMRRKYAEKYEPRKTENEDLDNIDI